ncbi:hypothetical protein [Pelagicoccus mobilis]|uniref:Uncharacterized protein n=1 Tax=Pelagicoccus mobilis TaxID=415221 RepID=A0A934VSR2_9BACT|nr:hypothetical protein [Pelagicoccus mobilis]MBK1880687.1 hypothetical protein [Pelagicoccus mobilis]
MRFSEDAIPAAVFVFERANGNELCPHEIEEIEKHGFETIDHELLVKCLRAELERERNVPDSRYRNACYWALGKRFDSGLLPFFRNSLKKELKRDMESSYQIMIALENLDEEIFSRESVSITDYDENRMDAERYLRRV